LSKANAIVSRVGSEGVRSTSFPFLMPLHMPLFFSWYSLYWGVSCSYN